MSASASSPTIDRIEPSNVVPGGRILVRGRGFLPERAHAHRVIIGDESTRVRRVSKDAIATIVPDDVDPASKEVVVELDGRTSAPFTLNIAETLASELQPVANPAIDRSGHVYVTLSGGRGEKLPVSIFSIDLNGPEAVVEPVAAEIVNPTGLAWGPDDHLYVSSRDDGTVYRVAAGGGVDVVCDELGTATGIAFDNDGILHVGDRRGTIFRIEPNGEPRSLYRLEPSVAAFHLAFDPEGTLYVTAPSLSTVDAVFRIDGDGNVEEFYRGFGRPQGMAFDNDGNLYVCEGLVDDGGVYRVRNDRSAEKILSAPPLVGMAFDGADGCVLAGTSSVYHIELGVNGPVV